MSTTSSAPFDPSAVAAALVGTWSYPASEEPTGIGYLHYSDDGRAFQFVSNSQPPDRRIPMRLWFSVESPSALRLRSKGSPDGWTCDYRLDGSTLTLISPTRSFTCRRLSPEEIPDWFRDALTASLSKP